MFVFSSLLTCWSICGSHFLVLKSWLICLVQYSLYSKPNTGATQRVVYWQKYLRMVHKSFGVYIKMTNVKITTSINLRNLLWGTLVSAVVNLRNSEQSNKHDVLSLKQFCQSQSQWNIFISIPECSCCFPRTFTLQASVVTECSDAFHMQYGTHQDLMVLISKQNLTCRLRGRCYCSYNMMQ